MRRIIDDQDAEDLFAHSRMPFGDHIEELRLRLWRALLGFAVVLILVFGIDAIGYWTGWPIGVARPVMQSISEPVERELERFYDRRVARLVQKMERGEATTPATQEPRTVRIELPVYATALALAPHLGLPIPGEDRTESGSNYVVLSARIQPMDWSLALHEAQRYLGHRPSLKTFTLAEGMMVYLKAALVCALVLGSPWVFYQIWGFIAAGLYPHETYYVRYGLPFSLALFLAGTLLCQLVVIPKAIEALLWFNEWLNWEPELRLSDWLSFAILMPLIFGISFQTPLVMFLMERIGVVEVEMFRRYRRMSWFGLAIFAAVATPSVEYVSMLFLWVPLGLLFELGIVLCEWAGQSPARQAE